MHHAAPQLTTRSRLSPRDDWRRPCKNAACALTVTMRRSRAAGHPGYCSEACADAAAQRRAG